MDIALLKSCLNNAHREELGVPYMDESVSKNIFLIAQWALEGTPQQARQMWFCVGNANELRDSLPPQIRGRILPVHRDQLEAWMNRGPVDALLLPEHGFFYSDPNLTLQTFWKNRGEYTKNPEFIAPGWTLWFWTPYSKPLRLFGMDHHHAVLWDMKKILRPLGIRIDFTWLCDGRPSVNEAIPSVAPPFHSSLDIYKTPIDTPLDPEFKEHILKEKYDGVITSHSIITSYRLKDLNLPLFHVNSTRFGNEWSQDPAKHDTLVKEIQQLLHTNRLHVVHNNRGDQQYFAQFFPRVEPHQQIHIPSLCESIHRIRTRIVIPKKFLIWDTRQVLLQQNSSPFMKELFGKLKANFNEAVDSQAILLAEKRAYLPEGYLDKYTAVIHLPYNISTMSIFEQTRSNIPVWVPSQRLLKELWANKDEPNELSWTVFAPGSEKTASPLDNVREPEIAEKWASWADFYYPETMGCILTFDSVDDLVAKIMATDYDSLIGQSEDKQQTKREEIFALWEQVFKSLRGA